MDIFNNNEAILREWQESNKQYGEENFAPDGIMCRGEIVHYGNGAGVLRDPGSECELWENAPLRILFLTKDQNAGGEDAWDVRGEVGRKEKNTDSIPFVFFRNLMYQLYGLANTTPSKKPNYDFTNRDAIELYDKFPLARINVKKEAGSSSIDNGTLKRYLERDEHFISRQIDNLDADIIVCCGYSESVEDSGNLLLNFLNKHGYNFRQQGPDNWIYYDADKSKVAVNNWHLSARISSETAFEELTSAYQIFLKAHPNFIKPHR